MSNCFFAGSLGLVVLALAARYIPVPWRGRALVLVVILGAARSIAMRPAHDALHWALPEELRIAVLGLATATIVGSLGLCGVGAMVVTNGWAAGWGLVGRPFGRQIIVGVLAGIGMGLAQDARIVSTEAIASLGGSWGPWMWVLFQVLASPWQEEVLCRGLALPALSRLLKRPHVANVVVALVFAALHLSFGPERWVDPGDIAYWVKRGARVFCHGWVDGYLRLRFGGIWAPYAAHATYNTILSLS